MNKGKVREEKGKQNLSVETRGGRNWDNIFGRKKKVSTGAERGNSPGGF